MTELAWVDTDGEQRTLQPLWDDGERLYCRTWRNNAEGARHALMAVLPAAEHPAPPTISRLAHEFALKDHLDGAWAARPLELVQSRGRSLLLLESHGTSTLDSLLGEPLELGRFLRLAPAITRTIGRLHERGLVHKDIKPANILLDPATDQVWLTGFGIASQLPRERQAPEPPEFIAGTFAYMAPEQTGRMNRSIDSRSDLYALGVTLYQMLTGALPFVAADPMEWVHCHIARKPLAPDQRRTGIPPPLSDIVMKLLAKMAEERYQTALGLEQDLRHCAIQWESQQRIEPFTLGRHEQLGRLLIPEKLYGRTREIALLQNAFDTIVEHPTTALVLVSGYTGVGKSSVVKELHKTLVAARGMFASGKFDQFKRDIPYATLAQAFQRLIREILVKSEAELGRWREILLHALEPHEGLIVDLVPELKLIIGEPEPVPELPAPDAQRRIQLLLRRFISIFARPEHPLVLFLDDLQWLDVATLDLLEDLLTQESVPHLLLIGAYRDNEVDSSHPLMRKLDSIKAVGKSSVEELTLGALDAQHVSQLIADALHCGTDRVGDLTQLILHKTGGNPFFINQFLSTLTDEGLIAFDSAYSRWSWDLERIHAKGYTDNVVDLMIGKLARLPAATWQAVQQLACLGDMASTAMLAIVHDTSEQELHASLIEARRQELVDLLEGSYRFVHDRIHEAAYAMIPTERRAAMHLRIGRMLVAHTPPGDLEEAIFEIVNQLNRASSLLTAPGEREQLAEFNLLAGRRAQASSAHVSALTYLTTGAALLTGDSWRQRRELGFALELARAQCEIACGITAEADRRLRNLAIRAVTTGERVAVACLQVDLYQGIDRSDEAVAVGLRALRHLGVDFPERPTEADARHAYDGVWTRLGTRSIEDLTNLPLMSDPDSLAAMDLLIRVAVPGHFFDSFHLFVVAVCTAVSLGLERGHSEASCIAYVQLGTLAGPHFGQFDAGYRFGRLGCELVDRPGLQRFKARTFETFGFLVPWTQHVRKGREFLFRGFDLARRIGEISYAGYACGQLNTNYLMAGDPLIETQEQAEHGLAFARKVGFGMLEGWILGQLGLVRSLRGLTTRFGSFDDSVFREDHLERDLAGNPALALPECWYYIRKLQARFLAGEYVDALQAASRAQPMLRNIVSLLEVVEYHFYAALCHASVHEAASSEERNYHRARLTEHLERLDTWGLHCPENFANRAALVGAELARIEGRELDAERLYEQAINSAHGAGLTHNEALANEMAGRFYLARGFERIATAYFREARDCYVRWGADAKVRQLEAWYPQIKAVKAAKTSSDMGTVVASIEQLDLATVIRVSEAVLGEIEQEKLIDTLMRTAIEHAGAERGVLILPHAHEYRIEAEATTAADGLIVVPRQANVTDTDLPASVFQFVLRSRESLLLHDAAAHSSYSTDEYIRQHGTRSMLCMPLLKQTHLLGVLYLENNLARDVFTPGRMTVLKLLASAAAVSLENTRLYSDLREREARVRRLVESNIIGIFIWNSDGLVIDANEAFLHIVGHDRDDLLAGRLNWRELTPPEWREHDDRAVAAVKINGVTEAYEKELFRKGGARVPVLAGAGVFDHARNEGVAFMVDLSDRKRAEDAARESERRYHDIQIQLEHANRVSTLGQLSASIAHEVNQPITGVTNNAHTALLCLRSEVPDLDRVRAALTRIVRDVGRASEVVRRIRALVRNAPPQKDLVHINDAIEDVVALMHAELVKGRVSCRTQPSPGLPVVALDRVQLQQVILNLIMNAVEAMSQVEAKDREIVISTSLDAEGIRVSVRDSGTGVNEANRERIFDAFYSTKPSGLGVGLSICRSIIEAHGGRLWASNAVPYGAIFEFTLPVPPHPAL